MGTSTELRVLGGLALRVDGVDRSVGGPKQQQLLSVLVAHAGRPVSIDRLIEALWANKPPKSAKATVQALVSRLRMLLRPGFAVTLEPAGYRLSVEDGGIDADRFKALVEESATRTGHDRVALLGTALELWSGPSFGEFADLLDVRSEAIRLDELRLMATDRWAEAKLATDDPASIVAELEGLVAEHPDRERLWRLLMVGLYRCGRQAEAMRRATQFRTSLRDESGLEPSLAFQAIEAQILADDPQLRTVDRPVATFSSKGTSAREWMGTTAFIARDRDLDGLVAAIVDEPVVTIVGPGGVGKTRLAMRVAGLVADRFGDGVTVIELASQRDPDGTAQVIARGIDIQPYKFQTIEATVREHLRSRNMLLLLDNCEHLLDVVAPLVDRLRSSCPGLHILATSREPLCLAGEYVWLLAPLEVPSADATSEEKLLSPAVRLFGSRAASATPGFILDDDNVHVVAEICRRLDGLPLGLELASARLRTMGLATLAVRLSQRSELDGHVQRGGDERHRTLHNLVEWSYELLSAGERETFEQLAVFAGGFDLAAAEAVCSVDSAKGSILSHVSGLADKSMLELVDPERPRYRMLETLREFGHGQLREHSLVHATEDRHLDWFIGRAEAGAAGLDGRDEPTWSDDLDREFDNFRVAHMTSLARSDPERALSLVALLSEFATRRVQYEITTWAEASLELPTADSGPNLATTIGLAAYGRFVRGDMAGAVELAQRGIDAVESTDVSRSGLPERVLGNALFYMERTDEALQWMSRMLDSARRSGNKGRIAHALYMSSVAATSVGDGIRGAILAGEAREAAGQVGSPTAQAHANYALGLALESVDQADALAHLELASAFAATARNRWVEAFSLTEVHWLQFKQGECVDALHGYASVIDLWHRGGDWANQWLSLRRVLAIFIDAGALGAASVLHGALSAVGASHAMPFEPSDAEQITESIDHLRAQLGPSEFADAVRLGAAMSDPEIVSFVNEQITLLIDAAA